MATKTIAVILALTAAVAMPAGAQQWNAAPQFNRNIPNAPQFQNLPPAQPQSMPQYQLPTAPPPVHCFVAGAMVSCR